MYKFFYIVCTIEPKIICMTETWLNDLFYNLFPNTNSLLCADQDYMDLNLTCSGGVLIAVYHYISDCLCRYDLELSNKYVWIEIPVNDCFNLLVRNHYFSPK
jgi:hypothetical protein